MTAKESSMEERTPPGDLTVTRRRRETTGKVVLEGDISSIPLPDVLGFMAMIRRTGRLILRRADLERTIHWKDGEVVFASSNSPEDSLGKFLLRNGKITQDQFDESSRRMTPLMRHGKVLVMMGAISPKDLWWGVKHQVLEIIYSLFTWKDGKFFFAEGQDEATEEPIKLSINTSSVIMEGIRRLDEVARIRERVTGPDMVFARVPGIEPNLHELELNDNEIRLLEQVDGKMSIRDLIRVVELTEFEATRILFQLLSARVVEAVPRDPSHPLSLDVEDSPELLKVVAAYNKMFERLYATLIAAVGEPQGREILGGVLQSSESDELWSGVAFDPTGRFAENMLIANVSELPFERRRAALEEGLNTLLSIALFEVSQHLDSSRKVDVFRFISEQKGMLE